MKRILMMLAIVLMVCGMVQAQVVQINPFAYSFSAVGTRSIENKHQFSSDVDNYIDPAWYNREIGNFMFLGGGWAPPVGGQFNGRGLSLGFGKTIGASYLGIYYGGALVDGSGKTTTAKGDSKDKETTESTDYWNSNLAVLFGIANMGIRLDVKLQDTDKRETQGGKVSATETLGNTSAALTFGMKASDALVFSATAGFKFPKETTTTNAATDSEKAPDKSMTILEGSLLGINGYADYTFNKTSVVRGGVGFAALFPDDYSGDKDMLSASKNTEKAFQEGGAWGANFFARYQHQLTFGNESMGVTTLRLRPRLDVSFTSQSNSTTLKELADGTKLPDEATDLPTDDFFALSPSFALGARYQYQKVAVYTSFSLRLLTWSTHGHTGGKEKDADTDWNFTGIEWTTASLGWGLTFTPVKNLVFGIDWTNQTPFNLNVQTMGLGYNGLGERALNDVGYGTFSLTVSYKFDSLPIAGGSAAASSAPASTTPASTTSVSTSAPEEDQE